MKISTVALAIALACAGPAFAANDGGTTRDPETGVTLHAPRVDDSGTASAKTKQFAGEVKAALHHMATATKRVVHRADVALRNAMHGDHSNRV
jgi:hypothetical protein